MVKVLIYSSKEIYNNSSYEGRAEADIVAYRDAEDNYCVMKDRTGRIGLKKIYGGPNSLKLYVRQIENDEWNREVAALKLQ